MKFWGNAVSGIMWVFGAKKDENEGVLLVTGGEIRRWLGFGRTIFCLEAADTPAYDCGLPLALS